MEAHTHTRIATRDPEVFASEIRGYARGPISVTPLSGRGFEAGSNAWSLPGVELFDVSMKAGHVTSPQRDGVLSLTFVLQGDIEVRVSGRSVAIEPGACFARDETEWVEFDSRHSTALVANVHSDVIDEAGCKLLDSPVSPREHTPPRVSLGTAGGAALWRRAASLWRDVRASAASGASVLTTAAVAAAEAELAAAAVRALSEDGREAPDSGRSHFRRAEDFILSNLRSPITRADICAAAGVSERSLSRAFTRHHGVGPMRFLKERRLDSAQRSLLAARPAERTVTEVAFEWGFHHLGRFTVEYRQTFGESPSETLRR